MKRSTLMFMRSKISFSITRLNRDISTIISLISFNRMFELSARHNKSHIVYLDSLSQIVSQRAYQTSHSRF